MAIRLVHSCTGVVLHRIIGLPLVGDSACTLLLQSLGRVPWCCICNGKNVYNLPLFGDSACNTRFGLFELPLSFAWESTDARLKGSTAVARTARKVRAPVVLHSQREKCLQLRSLSVPVESVPACGASSHYWLTASWRFGLYTLVAITWSCPVVLHLQRQKMFTTASIKRLVGGSACTLYSIRYMLYAIRYTLYSIRYMLYGHKL